MKTNYVLVDFENVMPENLHLLDQEWIRVLIFVGKNQTKIPLSVVKDIQKLGSRAQYIEMSGIGHNALDFHIAFYIGRITGEEKDAYFHIVSNDTGFDPLITHLKLEHIFADRVTRIEEIPALVQANAISKSSDERIALAKDRLIKPNVTHPRSRKTLTSHISAMFLKALSEEEVARVVDGLFSCGFVREEGSRLIYVGETSM